MKFEEILGFHGVVLRTDRLEEDARRWSKALGLPILRRTADVIVLGSGPEFFVELRRVRGNASSGTQEVHVAVRGLRGAREPTRRARWHPRRADDRRDDTRRARVRRPQFRRVASGPSSSAPPTREQCVDSPTARAA